MIFLNFVDKLNEWWIDLTSDGEEPMIYNTYGGSFGKDYIEGLEQNKGIHLFNQYSEAIFKERIEVNGSRFKRIEKGIRVCIGPKPQRIEPYSHTSFSDAIFKSMQKYLLEWIKIKGPSYPTVKKNVETVPFHLINVVFSIKGAVNYLVCLSINEELSTYFLKKMIEEDGLNQELHALLIDHISEICNIIVGNAFSVFEEYSSSISLGVPIIFRFKQKEIMTSNHAIKMGELKLRGYRVSVMVLDLNEVNNG